MTISGQTDEVTVFLGDVTAKISLGRRNPDQPGEDPRLALSVRGQPDLQIQGLRYKILQNPAARTPDQVAEDQRKYVEVTGTIRVGAREKRICVLLERAPLANKPALLKRLPLPKTDGDLERSWNVEEEYAEAQDRVPSSQQSSIAQKVRTLFAQHRMLISQRGVFIYDHTKPLGKGAEHIVYQNLGKDQDVVLRKPWKGRVKVLAAQSELAALGVSLPFFTYLTREHQTEKHMSVMPLYNKGSLKRCGLNFTPAEKYQAALHIGEQIVAAHGRRVIHRDIKPDNVLVDQQQGTTRVALVDWDGSSTEQQMMKNPTAHFGSPRYMPPEEIGCADLANPGTEEKLQCRPITCPYAKDAWSFGMLLYGMATGGAYPEPMETVDNQIKLRALHADNNPAWETWREQEMQTTYDTLSDPTLPPEKIALAKLKMVALQLLDKNPETRLTVPKAVEQLGS
jgi:serine/threonine protein kinase